MPKGHPVELDNVLIRVLLLPVIPLVFAYLELGGNWYAYRLFERVAPATVIGTLAFSIAYSLVAAGVARYLELDLSLLMVNYGFGFAMVALLVRLEWGRLPEFTLDLLTRLPALWLLLVIAAIGFVISAAFVVVSRPE